MNVPDLSIIFHYFPWLPVTVKFYDFPGLESYILEFQYFPGFEWPVQTLINETPADMANFITINGITYLIDLSNLDIVDWLSLAIQLKKVIVLVDEIAHYVSFGRFSRKDSISPYWSS